MPNDGEVILVCVRSNTGEDAEQALKDEGEAQTVAKAARVTTNHMVCIEVDGCRMQRWDRDCVVGENRWHKVDPDEMETLGPIREVRRA
ncbi:hypothetical protein [Burkholderia stabilis]|uniref:type IV pilus biogenesis protein PilI n=1 Tax=Burkholderia stabilis TaxID=95485 RepID=UPI001F4A8146|nr:hypothetical protein [Burkholderia stabilis]